MFLEILYALVELPVTTPHGKWFAILRASLARTRRHTTTVTSIVWSRNNLGYHAFKG